MCGCPKMLLETWSWILPVILKKQCQWNILVTLIIKSMQWFNKWPANNDSNFVWKPHLNPHGTKCVPKPKGLLAPSVRVLELAHTHSWGQLYTSLHSTISSITGVAWNRPWGYTYTTEIAKSTLQVPSFLASCWTFASAPLIRVGVPAQKTAQRHLESESVTENMLQGKDRYKNVGGKKKKKWSRRFWHMKLEEWFSNFWVCTQITRKHRVWQGILHF